MRLLIFVILGALLLFLQTAAAVVNAIDVRFETPVPPQAKQLATRASVLLDGGLPADTVADSLSVWLERLGYLDATALTTVSALTVKAGAVHVLRGTPCWRPRVHNARAAVYPRSLWPDALEAVLQPVRDSGYFYAQARVVSVADEDQSVTVEVAIEPGAGGDD